MLHPASIVAVGGVADVGYGRGLESPAPSFLGISNLIFYADIVMHIDRGVR
jgi:hypothetical protein